MTEKKKTIKKPTKLSAAPKAKKPVVEKREDVYTAIDVARIIGLSKFDFFRIKQEKNIDDGSLVSISTMQKYYKEVIEGR